MRIVEYVVGALVGLAIVNILFFSKNTTGVINASFSGTDQLFKTLISPGSGL